jgi:ProP effector
MTDPRHLLATLSAAFRVFRDCLPLAIGIHKVIKERLPDMDPQQLKVAMRMHTASTRYLKVLSQADTRFDLDGAPAGEVTAEQRQQALDTLRDRFKKQADRHKAEQLAKQQQEKLQQLAAKFNAR